MTNGIFVYGILPLPSKKMDFKCQNDLGSISRLFVVKKVASISKTSNYKKGGKSLSIMDLDELDKLEEFEQIQ